jgi:hypothetical protein
LASGSGSRSSADQLSSTFARLENKLQYRPIEDVNSHICTVWNCWLQDPDWLTIIESAPQQQPLSFVIKDLNHHHAHGSPTLPVSDEEDESDD